MALVLAAGLLFATVAQPSPVGAAAGFSAHGSVNQVWVVDLQAGAAVELLDEADAVVASGVADTQGAFLFRAVEAGAGYRVRQSGEVSTAVTVTDPTDHPASSFYDSAVVGGGFGYLPTRDGTLLSVNVTFPSGYQSGNRYPVLIDYSGYDPSKPGAPPAEAQALTYQGYVVVGINMRGTGCSGGAFDYFETLQGLDGYDAIEVLARQSWSNGDVGMVGISYSGISQLFVARWRPPHLRAITPLSVIADTARSTMYPGGIRNEGFALSWATDRANAAKPAAAGWAKARIDDGDTTCAANQAMRLQSADLLSRIPPYRFYTPDLDQLAPRTFLDQIDVPVYLSGSFQDEQTGGHFSTMVPDFAPGTKRRVTLTNGTHADPLGPQQLTRLLEFLDFYVGRRVPQVSPVVRATAPTALAGVFGASGLSLPPDRFTGMTYGAALAAYEAEDPVRILWENGAGASTPGAPVSTAETTYADFPTPGTSARAWYLQPDGLLGPSPSMLADDEPRGVSSYVYDPSTKSDGTFSGSRDAIFKAAENGTIDWRPLTEGRAHSFVTEPFSTETAMAGWGSVDLWLRTEEADSDLEVTITEVRPDGEERYVQSGWLRASMRATDPALSSTLLPFQTGLEADAAPMPAGEFTPVRVALFPFAHVFRPGSRLRLNIEAPGGNQPFWRFTTLGTAGSINEVAHSSGRPSRVVLPVLPADESPDVPAAFPACPSLRNQPCRAYLPDRIPTSVQMSHIGDRLLEVRWQAPERGGVPDAYRVTIDPTGEAIEVAGDATALAWASARDGVRYRASVQAVYGTEVAPASNASLSAGLEDPALSTTTTSTTSTPPVTQTPSGQVLAAADATPSSGTLPTTGSDPRPAMVVGLGLVALGAALGLLSRRASQQPAGGR